MKEKILKFLMENTQVEGRYIGGGDEPQIIVFKWSDDEDKETFLSEVAEKLERELSKEPEKLWFNDRKTWEKERHKLATTRDAVNWSKNRKKLIAIWHKSRGEGWIIK